MADFGLKKSFHIDNGELDGKTPQDCFVLGYELGYLDREIENCLPIKKLVHAANKERIETSLRDVKRKFALRWLPADVSEEWMELEA